MIVLSKLCIGSQSPCQQSTGQRHTCQDTDLPLRCSGKEFFRWLESKHVENDLDALKMRIGDCLERLIYAFHAHTVKTNLALLCQVVEDAKDLRHVINFGRRAVELEEVERLCFQVAQAPLDKAGQVLAVITRRGMGVKPPPRFCRDNQLFAAGLTYLGDQLLRVTVAIDISSINKDNAQIDSFWK